MGKKNDEVVPGSDNVEQIRDILFGGHIKDYEQRFRVLESKLEQAQQSINEAFNRRLDDIANSVGELKSLLERESTQRVNAVESLDGLIQNQSREASEALSQVESQASVQVQQVEKALTHLSAELTQQLAAQSKAADKAIAELGEQLGDSSVSRKELASLLGGLAQQLDGAAAKSQKRR